jgi:cAMP phosphodiesterase
MKLKVLGCSGGIGGSLRTTSMLIDNDVLIDAGTGVSDLGLEELKLIDHVFVTHAHLDHIVCIPLMLDSVADMREYPLIVYATAETVEALQKHIFNWKIWPDFSKIPAPEKPLLRYQIISVGETISIKGRAITPLPANHVVPAVGYQLDSGAASVVFTGDTGSQDVFWERVNEIENLKYLIIETAFSNLERDLAVLSKHLCPSLLAEELSKLQRKPEIYITHLKPGVSELTMRQIGECVKNFAPKMLKSGQVIEF